MASRQTATIATSCSIWPHEILAFTTSTFPSFYSSYILAHFQVLTIQSHATQLTTLCAEVGGAGRVRCFCLGISGGSCINPFLEVGGPRLFSQKNSKIPRPTYLNKKRTFPETFCMGIQVNWIKGIHLTSSFFKDEYDRDKSFELFHYG